MASLRSLFSSTDPDASSGMRMLCIAVTFARSVGCA